MSMNRAFLFVILCNLVRLGWTAEGGAATDMPTVMEAIIHAMIDFRKEILDNLQLSLEYHTEQLEEIKVHVEHEMEEQEKRMKMESETKFKELREEILNTLNQQQNSLSVQVQDLKNQSIVSFKMLQEDTNRISSKTSLQITNIEKALGEISSEFVPSSCDRMKFKSSGTFYVGPYGNIAQKFLVFCNVDNIYNLGGGWTVFQRRIDGSVNFHRNWTMYKYGFGDVNGEHWLGLEKLHIMTRSGRHELLVLLKDFEGSSTYALYDEFKISSEVEKYKLTVGKHSGTAGDSLKDHNGMKFSTFDGDNDKYEGINCANAYGGGWWYVKCYRCNLNGPYFESYQEHVTEQGIVWAGFRGFNYSLKSATMMFRSRSFG